MKNMKLSTRLIAISLLFALTPVIPWQTASAQDFSELLVAIDRIETSLAEMVQRETAIRDQQISELKTSIAGLGGSTVVGGVTAKQLADVMDELMALRVEVSGLERTVDNNAKQLASQLEFGTSGDERLVSIISELAALQAEIEQLRDADANRPQYVSTDKVGLAQPTTIAPPPAPEGGGVSWNGGVDFPSRYLWRGLDLGDAQSVQPYLSLAYGGLEIGAWAAYPVSNDENSYDEVDLWLAYTLAFNSGVSLTALVTDFYYPSTESPLFNYDNYNNENGPGAHTIELGFGVSGPEAFPLSLFGYVNAYNDEGHNAYFELGYSAQASDVALDFFLGTAAGSKDNPAWYGTDDLEMINLGLKLSREIAVTNTFSLPISITYAINPEAELSYLVFSAGL